MSQGDQQATSAAEACRYTPHIDQAERILRQGFLWLTFPRALERQYRHDSRREAALAFRYRSVFIFLLYLLLSSGIYTLMPEGDRWRWLSMYSWVGAIIVGAAALSRVARMEQWFAWYAGAGSLLAVAISVAVTGVMRDGIAGQLTQAAIMYAVIIVYAIVGLNLRTAVVAGWGGGLLGAMLSSMLGGEIDWEVTHRTYTGGSLLGMAICYLIEHGHRRMYLQARMLELARARSDAHAEAATTLSHTDPLTGLANRRLLNSLLGRIWRQARRDRQAVSLLMIDVDRFKPYNDYFGHITGDECLKRIAAVLAGHASRAADLAVRYGGEEFLLVLPHTERSVAGRMAEHLRQTVSDMGILMPDGVGVITVSVGVASGIPGEGVSVEALLREADKALYEAKHSGRNRVVIAEPGSAAPPVDDTASG